MCVGMCVCEKERVRDHICVCVFVIKVSSVGCLTLIACYDSAWGEIGEGERERREREEMERERRGGERGEVERERERRGRERGEREKRWRGRERDGQKGFERILEQKNCVCVSVCMCESVCTYVDLGGGNTGCIKMSVGRVVSTLMVNS